MIISRGRSYIFVHIPKTGGTSLALALEGRAMKDDIMLGDTPKALKRRRRLKDAQTRGRLWKHSTLADIDGLLRPEEIAGMFCFTLVRNPWDRMVSYYHWLREQSLDHPAMRRAKALEFSGFLNDPLVAASFARFPARSYLTDASGAERAALYIRLEHFEVDAAPLWRHLGFALDLPRLNASARLSDYRRYYSDADADRLAIIAADDIRRFGYRFE
ncbi:sulfotransferase family 2 domain-containing protein [Marimonas arenosa]|uniref:Sulfotransferase family protein n=1 Tax=Marimonas arenosa TaxID=1795305 RepID=A0AAE4B460_9RHOB|nr:sulfotransferase family 2 domain-containing protein [Marimonas arenosa]MDQ2089900.1 sulfotransferase family protein [Marimonas arenosa]